MYSGNRISGDVFLATWVRVLKHSVVVLICPILIIYTLHLEGNIYSPSVSGNGTSGKPFPATNVPTIKKAIKNIFINKNFEQNLAIKTGHNYY